MRRMFVTAALVLGVIAMAVPAIGSGGSHTNATQLVATLTGLGQSPAIQTATTGIAHVTIDVDKRLICYDYSVTGKAPVAVHIHDGDEGTNGPIAVDFGSFGKAIRRTSEGCTRGVARAVLTDIAANPEGYYVNVHSSVNPGGEVRGQLSG